jgi:hypothetical protein
MHLLGFREYVSFEGTQEYSNSSSSVLVVVVIVTGAKITFELLSGKARRTYF